MAKFVENLRSLLDTSRQLPTLPTVVFQLKRALDSDTASSQQVAAVIERDPSLTASLLRAANSAAMVGLGGERIASVQAAIARLGLRQVRSIGIALAMVKAFKSDHRGLDHERFWIHSAAVGMLAEQLWLRLNVVSELLPDDVYVAGLVHDVGILVLDQFFPEEFAGVRGLLETVDRPRAVCEQAQLGMDHGAIGGMLLGKWGLPDVVTDTVSYHHNPGGAPEDSQLATQVIGAAEAACTERELGLVEEGPADCPALDRLLELGLDQDEVAEVWDDLERVRERAGNFMC